VAGFAHWVAQECPPHGRVLNIGAGRNLSGELRPVRRRAGELVGVDPDPAVADNTTLDEQHCQTLEQYAAGDPDPFDLAFSVFVLEHVADPRGFTLACARVLRPGGTVMALTVNKWHYFGLTTWAATRTHVAEPLLRKLRPTDQVEAYHFATEYRINTVGRMTRHLRAAGFTSVEFRCWDLPGMYEPYLPTAARPFAQVYDRWAYRTGIPYLMGHITFCARLPASPQPTPR
jgi:2-polyprenyl-3-methyl-5-hydroxy-6-metoxy-1,4-benzoquinol methylase